MKLIGVILIALGIIVLVYQGFHYTKREEIAKIGSIEITSENRKFVWIPPVIGVIAIIAGGVMVANPKFLKKFE